MKVQFGMKMFLESDTFTWNGSGILVLETDYFYTTSHIVVSEQSGGGRFMSQWEAVDTRSCQYGGITS